MPPSARTSKTRRTSTPRSRRSRARAEVEAALADQPEQAPRLVEMRALDHPAAERQGTRIRDWSRRPRQPRGRRPVLPRSMKAAPITRTCAGWIASMPWNPSARAVRAILVERFEILEIGMQRVDREHARGMGGKQHGRADHPEGQRAPRRSIRRSRHALRVAPSAIERSSTPQLSAASPAAFWPA